MDRDKLKSLCESILFVWGEPIDVSTISDELELERDDVLEAMLDLQQEYAERESGLEIRRGNDSFQLCTNPENAEEIRKFLTPVKEKRLSQSALEVLAIIAYQQPVTKGTIEKVRGIKCDRVVEGLVSKGLIEPLGKADTLGKPMLYGTTDLFLHKFGYEDLSDLPKLEVLDAFSEIEENME